MSIFTKYHPLITAIIIFFVYYLTLAPTIIHLDAGELTAVQATLGIAHPTGYPLFTFVGYIISNVFSFFDPVLILNLLAAFYCALSVYIFIKLISLILNTFSESYTEAKKIKLRPIEISLFQKSLIASILGLTIGLGKTFWFQSTSVEVYSFHLLLISFIIYFTLKAYNNSESKNWFYVAIFLALGFSNHMTTILLIPGIAFLFFKQNRFEKKSFILIGKMLIIFIPLLLIIYSYLPLRALQEPILIWGNPIDFERIIRHISGKQYQVWIFSSLEAAKKQFVYFIQTLPLELGYITLLTSVIGIPLMIKYSKTMSLFWGINFFGTLFYSINYDISDIDAYFLLAFISLTIFSSAVFVNLLNKLKDKLLPTLLVIPLIMLLVNFNNVDQSKKYAFEDYTKAVLNNTTENSIVFSYLWDYFISPSYYFQYVENYRGDVVIIDKELLRRSWYFSQLKNNYPEVMNNISSQTESFLIALQPFERDEPYNAQILEERFRILMTSLIANNIEHRDFYITPELFFNEITKGEFSIPEGYKLVPMELVFKVVENSEGYVSANHENIKIRFSDNPNHYETTMRRLIVNIMLYRIMYELQYEMFDAANKIYNEVKTEYSEYRIPPAIVEKLENKR